MDAMFVCGFATCAAFTSILDGDWAWGALFAAMSAINWLRAREDKT